MSGHIKWRDLRARLVAEGKLDEDRLTEGAKRLQAEIRAYRLAEMRATYLLNQSDVAERIGISQSRVSRIERGDLDHTEIATVRDYVEALGGELEVLAKFGDERIVIG